MEQEDAQAEQQDTDDGKNQQRRCCVISCRSEPADQADLCYDHYPQPKSKIDELFFKTIEFRHGGSGPSMLKVYTSRHTLSNAGAQRPGRASRAPVRCSASLGSAWAPRRTSYSCARNLLVAEEGHDN